MHYECLVIILLLYIIYMVPLMLALINHVFLFSVFVCLATSRFTSWPAVPCNSVDVGHVALGAGPHCVFIDIYNLYLYSWCWGGGWVGGEGREVGDGRKRIKYFSQDIFVFIVIYSYYLLLLLIWAFLPMWCYCRRAAWCLTAAWTEW